MAKAETISRITFFLPADKLWAGEFEECHKSWKKTKDQCSVTFEQVSEIEVTEDGDY